MQRGNYVLPVLRRLPRKQNLSTAMFWAQSAVSTLSLGYEGESYNGSVQCNPITESHAETAASLPVLLTLTFRQETPPAFLQHRLWIFLHPKDLQLLCLGFNERRCWFWKQLCGQILGWLCHLYTCEQCSNLTMWQIRDDWLSYTQGTCLLEHHWYHGPLSRWSAFTPEGSESWIYIHYSSGSSIHYSSKQSKFLFQNVGGHFITTQEFPDAD